VDCVDECCIEAIVVVLVAEAVEVQLEFQDLVSVPLPVVLESLGSQVHLVEVQELELHLEEPMVLQEEAYHPPKGLATPQN
jgi:hypothetical protein